MLRLLLVSDDDDLITSVRDGDHDGDLRLLDVVPGSEPAIACVATAAPDLVVLDGTLPIPELGRAIEGLHGRAPSARFAVLAPPPQGGVARNVTGRGPASESARAADLRRALALAAASSPASVELEPDPTAPAAARRFTNRFCDEHGCNGSRAAAELVVSELVTNAVRHARSASTLRLHLHDGVLRVEVADDAAALPLPSDPAPSEPTGRGLLLVGSLSTAWGIDPRPTGKVTWADLPVG